jgi:hypothetical protein
MVRTYLGNERSVVLVESDGPPKHRNAAAGERNIWLPTPCLSHSMSENGSNVQCLVDEAGWHPTCHASTLELPGHVSRQFFARKGKAMRVWWGILGLWAFHKNIREEAT